VVCSQCGTQNNNRNEACIRCKRPLHPAAMKGKIPCYVHANREATTSCALCGHRLCASCAVAHNGIMYCDPCAPATAMRQSYDEDYEKLPVLNPEKIPAATFDARFIAAALDISIVAFLIALVIGSLWLLTGGALDFLSSPRQQPVAFYLLFVMAVVGVPLYLFLPVALSGQTLGHRLTNIIVLQPDGHVVTVNQAAIRMILQFVSAIPFFVGFAWMIWDPEKLTWHDRVSGTRVFEYARTT
jgi:uncharacterized RDD family membrane protein YckC